jgi:glutamyl-tRNA synthetase
LPDALVNYLVRLGWSYGDQEVFTSKELVEYFTFENVGKSPAVFNPEKLLWLNAQYIMNSTSERLGELVMPFLIKEGTVSEGQEIDMAWLAKAIDTLKERSKTLLELSSSLRYYIVEDVEYDEKAKAKFLKEESRDLLVEVKDGLAALSEFSEEAVEKLFNEIVERHETKLGKLAQPVRVALTGTKQSPGIYDVIGVLGKDMTVKRLERAIESI